MHPARGENARRRPEAQVVHMFRNVEPAVHDPGRDDDDVPRLHVLLHDVVRHAATRRPVEVRREVVASVDDVAVLEHRAAAPAAGTMTPFTVFPRWMMPTVKFSWPISTTLMFRSVPCPSWLTMSTSSFVMYVAVVGFVFAP